MAKPEHARCCSCCDVVAAFRASKEEYEKKRGTRRRAKYFRDYRAKRKAAKKSRKPGSKPSSRS